MRPKIPFCTLLATALLALCALPAAAQFGPYNLLSGGTNNIGTNYITSPPTTVRIAMGSYSQVGLQVEARTVAAGTTNEMAFAFRRSVDGLTYETNLWLVVTNCALTGASTNRWLTNFTVGPFYALHLVWLSNKNENANATNCLTNIAIRYLLR